MGVSVWDSGNIKQCNNSFEAVKFVAVLILAIQKGMAGFFESHLS